MWTEDFVRCLEESTTGEPRVDEAIALKEQHLPRRIYKDRYDTDRSRDNLKSDTVWMASPETYNDPYDGWLTFPCDTLLAFLEAALVDRFVAATKLEGVLSRQEIENAKRSPEPLKTILEYVRASKPANGFQYWAGKAQSYSDELLRHARGAVSQIEGLRNREKVCSFSAVNDSLLMWSHYADQHKGFCIEYDIEALRAPHFFRKNLYPVLYSKKVYDLRPFVEGLFSGPRRDFRPLIPLLGMLHKFDGCGYEKEWRRMHETEASVEDHTRAAPIPSRIFLGARFDRSTGSDLLAICRQKGIPMFQMRLAEDRFAVFPREFVG